MSEECCNHNCNQGRDCPLRKTQRIMVLDGNRVYPVIKELTDEEKIKKLETENDALRKTVDSLFAGLDSSINLNKAQAERRVKETLDTRSYLMGRYDTSPIKELTDEEIGEVEKLCKKPLASWAWQVEFARAILRKAQEK